MKSADFIPVLKSALRNSTGGKLCTACSIKKMQIDTKCILPENGPNQWNSAVQIHVKGKPFSSTNAWG